MSDPGDMTIWAVLMDRGFNVQGNGVPFSLTMKSNDTIDVMKQQAQKRQKLDCAEFEIEILKILPPVELPRPPRLHNTRSATSHSASNTLVVHSYGMSSSTAAPKSFAEFLQQLKNKEPDLIQSLWPTDKVSVCFAGRVGEATLSDDLIRAIVLYPDPAAEAGMFP